MPVYLLTFHTYRSWTADHPKGYVQRRKPGIQPPNIPLAAARDQLARQLPVLLNRKQQMKLIQHARDICSRRNWNLYAAAVTPTHLHLLLGWRQGIGVQEVSTALKRLMGLMLSRESGKTGGHWFSRGCSRRPVTDKKHLEHLVAEYLPRHQFQNGAYWCSEAL
ncbi:MAG: hypothetical protein IT443_06080 [Phycisphaeraceae bacterium]|nr:hypothetical protein [Phycisphaeraceae bacterium]